MARALLALSFLLAVGCEEASLATCLAFQSKEQCLRAGMRRQALGTEGSRELSAGARVRGDSGAYSLRVPSDEWIQLSAGRNARFPDRDLRLVHELGAFVDGFVVPPDDRPLDELARERLPDSMPECRRPDVADIASDSRSSLLRCCREHDVDGQAVTMCHYAVASSRCGAPVVVAGAASPQVHDGSGLPGILSSLRCIQ